MSWIILALTLGASITSIIHGVFMLFGSLTISSANIFGIPSTILAVLPVISAVFALIGGIIAFNRSKWGALFLFFAGSLCVPSRDTWLYGGIYFITMFLCFLLKSNKHNEYQNFEYEDDYGSEIPDNDSRYYEQPEEDQEQDFYYDDEISQPQHSNSTSNSNAVQRLSLSPVERADSSPVVNNEPPKLRQRMSKICPDCGAIVARDSRFCPNCGAKLFVAADNFEVSESESQDTALNDYNEIQDLNSRLLTPSESPTETAEPEKNFKVEIENIKVHEINNNDEGYYEPEEGESNFNENDGDYMRSNTRTVRSVKPSRSGRGYSPRKTRLNEDSYDETAASYQHFSKISRSAKVRKRSAARKILSMMLLVAAVGGALYFLLGLRKLPPGELPPMGRETLIVEENNPQGTVNSNSETQNNNNVAQPVDLVVAENILPNFVPERNPKSGVVIGSNVNVRADHTTSSNRVTRLSVGSKVNVIGTFNVPSGQYSGLWYNITTGGREGWIYGRYLQPLGSGLPVGYSNALLKSFGSTRSQIVESLGNPSRSSNTSAEWAGLTATLSGENITKIRLTPTSSNRELQNGLKAGMSLTALYQIMGYPSGVSGKVMQYNEGGKTGLSVQLDNNNNISAITVNEIR